MTRRVKSWRLPCLASAERIVGYGESQAARPLADSALPQIRNIVGDEAFGHLLKFQSPELSWSPGTHVEVFAD